MINYESFKTKMFEHGYRKGTVSRDEDGFTAIDFRQPRRLDIYTAYLNSYGSIERVEKTKVIWNNVSRRYEPSVTRMTSLAEVIKSMGFGK